MERHGLVKRIYFFCIISYLFLSGCSNQGVTTVQEYTPPPAGIVPEYRIGIDDVLTVNVWRHPDLNITVPVRPDGKISVPLVGDVSAGGKTPENVSRLITKKIEKFIRDPQVTVIVSNLRSHEYLTRLRVIGSVRKPLSLTFRQGITVLDAVLAAGGLNDFASSNNTKLYRKENGKTVIISIYLDDILYDGDLETNLLLKSGDIISVPERLF